MPRKARKTKQLKRKQPSARRRKAAIGLLTKWADTRERVHYIGQSSGLQHPGVIKKFDTSLGTDDFIFVGTAGAKALIFPLTWTDVRVEVVGKAFQSVFVTSHSLHFTIRSSGERAEAEAANKAAEDQLVKWAVLKAQLYIFLVGPFPTISFFSTIVIRENGVFAVGDQPSRVFCSFSLRDAICKLEKHGDNTVVQVRDEEYAVCISETPLTAIEMIQRFAPASRGVH